MKVLLSIRPEYAEKILIGEKQFEFRKCIPKAEGVNAVVIYATVPVGKVVGEFEIETILTDEPRRLWLNTSFGAGITKKFFSEYFRGRSTAHAIKVKSVRRYQKPIELRKV